VRIAEKSRLKRATIVEKSRRQNDHHYFWRSPIVRLAQS
jgi:hypothetical protein